jgi:hypothetical protein
LVESRWHHQADLFHLNVVIPANSDASVSIPLLNFNNATISENGKTVWKDGAFVAGVPGVADAKIDKTNLTFSVGSGSYEFTLSGN